MLTISPTVAIGVAVLLIFVLLSFVSSGGKPTQGARLPGGPPGTPIVDNLLDIPPKHSWLQFYEWSKKYGALYRLRLAGREHYIVSTEKIANDLLRERGSIYSSREQLPAAVKLLGGDLRPLFWPHGEVFRNGRKLMHQLCMPSAAISYQPTQLLESTMLLYDLIRDPAEYEQWLMRYSSGIIFRLGFGKVMKQNDPLRDRIFSIVHNVERVASPGAYLVDTFPILMHLPDWLAPFKRELKQLHAKELNLFRGLMDDVRGEITAGTAPECWEKTYLDRKDTYALTDDQGAYVVCTLFEAGAGTTAAAMMSLILAMVQHPEEFEKLQNQVDLVVGKDRMPEFDDLPKLPRVRAVVKETLRWRPVTAGGLPHLCTKDDIYRMDPNGESLFIPKNTNIHPNQWAIHREEALYPDPESFRPERWLESGWPTYREPLSQFPNIQNFSGFGFGRRICPGMHIAERSLNILTARIAWACCIGKKTGPDGQIIDVPLYDYCSGFNVQPNKFAFDLRVRSPEKMEIVEQARERALTNDPLKAGRGL